MTQHSYTKSSLDYCITKKSREITSNIWKSRKIATYYVKSLSIAKTINQIAQKKRTVEHEYVLTVLKYVIRNKKIKMNHTKSHSITPFKKIKNRKVSRSINRSYNSWKIVHSTTTTQKLTISKQITQNHTQHKQNHTNSHEIWKYYSTAQITLILVKSHHTPNNTKLLHEILTISSKFQRITQI